MFQLNFEWDPAKAHRNSKKHGVSFELASSVFRDPLMISVIDNEHSQIEERWITLGQAENGKLLVVIHTFSEFDYANASIRVISARLATKPERRQYEARL